MGHWVTFLTFFGASASLSVQWEYNLVDCYYMWTLKVRGLQKQFSVSRSPVGCPSSATWAWFGELRQMMARAAAGVVWTGHPGWLILIGGSWCQLPLGARSLWGEPECLLMYPGPCTSPRTWTSSMAAYCGGQESSRRVPPVRPKRKLRGF